MIRVNFRDDWEQFTPSTNLMWLHYLALKLFSAKKVKATRKKEIMLLLDKLLEFESTKVFLQDREVIELLERCIFDE